jgi:hypothetical protein
MEASLKQKNIQISRNSITIRFYYIKKVYTTHEAESLKQHPEMDCSCENNEYAVMDS